MAPRYRVTLESDERGYLLQLTRTSNSSGKLFRNARAMLLCDRGPEGQVGWTVAKTAEALGVSSRTIEHLKRRFVQRGLAAALRRKPRPRKPRAVTFDGEFEAPLIALACSPAPSGRRRWTVRLLAAQAVELGFVARVSPMTVQRILKKQTASSLEEVLARLKPARRAYSDENQDRARIRPQGGSRPRDRSTRGYNSLLRRSRDPVRKHAPERAVDLDGSVLR